jgi:outer membrane protein assembly factor BamB
MRRAIRRVGVIVGCLAIIQGSCLFGQDWSQWRGPNRDAIATGFVAPQTWPKSLKQKWKVTVGNGVSTPALVGDRLYIFARRGNEEVACCLDATTGKELWADKYAAKAPEGQAARFPGPRSSPTVVDGKIVTLGVRGTLSCLDAATGKKIWRKTDFADAVPRFYASSSPLVVDGRCIVQLGGEKKGGIVAYDLLTGDEQWKCTDDGTAYSSPELLMVEGVKTIVAMTSKNIMGLEATDGKLLWWSPFVMRGGACNAATPIVSGQTVYISGSMRGVKALKIEKQPDQYTAKEQWMNPDYSVQFNTPVLKNGLLFGISSESLLFCIHADTGYTAWTESFGGERGNGSIVDAGSVLLALTTDGNLLVVEPSEKHLKQVASYKVAKDETYAYPIAAGKRLYIKDLDSVILWTLD